MRVMAGLAAGAILAPMVRLEAASSGKAENKIRLTLMAPSASEKYPYQLPPLPYPAESLTAAIDPQTMQIHHGAHHQAYTNKLNAALEKNPQLQNRALTDMLANLESVPEDIRGAVRNHGGGYFNHSLFWPMMSPQGGGIPAGKLDEKINLEFGSFDSFRVKFNQAAGNLFGSGWAWLVLNGEGKLEIITTSNQDTPLATGHKPVLGLDVWEHAYYLRYQNKRNEYIENFWKVVNWKQAESNFEA